MKVSKLPSRGRCAVAMAALLAVLASAWAPVAAAPIVGGRPQAQPPSPPSDPMATKLAAGRAALEQRDYKAAEARFQEAAAIDRRSPLPLLELADSARQRGDAAAARHWLDAAAAAAPRHPATLRAWGHWHYAQGERDKALASLQAAVAADPRFAAAWADLGDYQVNVVGDLRKAAEHYQQALAIEPARGGTHYALGVVRLRMGELPAAGEHLSKAAELTPKNPLPHVALAELHVKRGALPQALDAYDRALAIQPSYYPARLGKADALAAAGRWEPALALFRQVAREQPKTALGHVGAGMAEQQLGRPADALRSYRAALAIEPDHIVALNNAAWLEARSGGDLQQALKWAQLAAKLAPNDARIAGTLAWTTYRAGNPAAARQQLERLVAGPGRERAESHHLLGTLLADLGEAGSAAARLREGLRLNPQHTLAGEATALLKRLESR